MARSTHITYRMTAVQRDCFVRVLATCHDNEHDKSGMGDDSCYSNQLLDEVWQMAELLDAAPTVNGKIVWRIPRWFPLEMVVEQYGPDNHREDDDGNMVLDVYDQIEPLLYQEQDALQSALVALYTAQERYETMGFYDDADNTDEVAVIARAIAAVKAVVSFEDGAE